MSEDLMKVENQIQVLQAEKEKLSRAKSHIEDAIRQERRTGVKDHVSAMKPEDVQAERSVFEAEMELQDTVTAQDFRELGWNMPFAETLFEMWLMSKVESRLFSLPFEEEVVQSVESAGLTERLESVNAREEKLIGHQRSLSESHSLSLVPVTNLNHAQQEKGKRDAA